MKSHYFYSTLILYICTQGSLPKFKHFVFFISSTFPCLFYILDYVVVLFPLGLFINHYFVCIYILFVSLLFHMHAMVSIFK